MITKIITLSRKTAVNNIYRYIASSSSCYQGSEIVKSSKKFDTAKIPEKKPKREPLVKNFNIAQVDTELLAFPEALIDNEAVDQAKMRRDTYEDFLKNNVFNVNETSNIEKLKGFGSFDCYPTIATEQLVSSYEPESDVLSYGTFISNHKVVAEVISKYSNEQVKFDYLNKMSRGELLGTVCMMESKPPQKENYLFNTVGSKYDDTWTLNGEKSYVLLNNLESSLLLVSATVDATDLIGDIQERVGLFLVNGNAKGVSIVETNSTIGFEEAPFKRVTIKLNNVHVESENSFLGDDIKISMNILNQMRMNIGIHAVCGVMKPMINKLSDFFINTRIQNTLYKDLDILKDVLGRLTAKCYALESMVYLTAGLKDIYEDQDIDLECGIIKMFAVEALSDFITAPLYSVGALATHSNEGYQKLIRDAIQLIGIEEPIDTLKQFIGLHGISHTGKAINNDVKMERNILDHPLFIFKRMRQEISIKNPKLKLNLWHYLHESLRTGADCTEASIYRLRAVIEILLARFGTQIFLHSVEIGKVAEIQMMCYAMFATCSRASRSYCIGLRNAEQEVILANALCFEFMQKVLKIAKDIDYGEFSCPSHYYMKLGDKLMENKKYNLEHPTTRNW